MRLIDADALIAKLKTQYGEELGWQCTVNMSDVGMMIEDAPTVDAVEVVHGEWLDNGDRDSNGVPKPFAISCSACGSSAGTDWMKYCPNCAAKMDGERKVRK